MGAGQEVGCDETGQELNWLAFVVAMVTIRPPLALHFSGIAVQSGLIAVAPSAAGLTRFDSLGSDASQCWLV